MAQLIVFLPLIGFLFCFFFGKKFNFKVSQILTTSLLFLSAILSWILFFSYIGERETQIIHIFNWFT
jgi:NADH-quinone oxidoreductase subunit L